MAELPPLPRKPTLCVDFDGVIHSYSSGWQGATAIPDLPVPGAMQWMLDASRLFTVVIYSSRSRYPVALEAMETWLREHAKSQLPRNQAERLLEAVTFAHEKPAAFLTIDDRAICFDGDWSKLDPETLLKFQPWNKR